MKLLPVAFRAERAAWSTAALDLLARRGAPVPRTLWQGQFDGHWWLVIQTALPGEPLRVLDGPALDQLLGLIELQVAPDLGPGGWDVSWWVSVVLFEGWEGWWEGAEAAAPETAWRLRALVEPAWGHRLPPGDLVHHDFSVGNVLTDRGAITGVVDWDDMGLGSRALDLTSLLFDWHRLALDPEPSLASGEGDRLIRLIVQIAGWNGLRCTVAYGAIARLALAAWRGESSDVEIWTRATEALLESAARARARSC